MLACARSLIAILLLAIGPVLARAGNLDLAAFSPSGLPAYLQPSGDRFEWHSANRLQVNAESSYRLVVGDLCQTDGEAELISLAAESELEEAFAFIPSRCLWIEVGYAETRDTVRTDHEFLFEILRHEAPVSIYHIHSGMFPNEIGYFPAYSDMLNVIAINGAGDSEKVEVTRHFAATSHGIYEYRFVPNLTAAALVAKMKQLNMSGYIAQNLVYLYASRMHEEAYYNAVRQCQTMISGDPGFLANCFPMSAGGFSLDFRPSQLLSNGTTYETETAATLTDARTAGE